MWSQLKLNVLLTNVVERKNCGTRRKRWWMEQATKLPLSYPRLSLSDDLPSLFKVFVPCFWTHFRVRDRKVGSSCGLVLVFDIKLKYKLRICCEAGRLCAVTDGWHHKVQTVWKELNVLKCITKIYICYFLNKTYHIIFFFAFVYF